MVRHSKAFVDQSSARIPGGVRKPLQQRSRASLERVYQACNELLQEQTFDAITIAQISAKSAVTVGSIYQRFGSKDALLWDLYEHYLDNVHERVNELGEELVGASSRSRASAVLELAVGLFRQHRGTVRSLLLRHQHSPGTVPAALSQRIETITARITDLLVAGQATDEDRLDLEFRYSVAVAACRDHLLFRSFRALAGQSDDKAFIDRLALIIFDQPKG